MPVLVPPTAGGLVLLISVLTLIGWQFRIRWLRDPFGGFMAPNTALNSIFLAIALILHRWKHLRWVRAGGFFFAAAAGSFASITLFEQFSGINTGLSQLFFHHRLSDWTLPTVPGRFAPNSAICIILLASSLIVSFEEVRKSLVEFLAALALLIAGLAAIGHTYGVPFLYSFEVRNAMAFVTSISLMLIGSGILFAVAHGGWMGIVLRNDAAGLLSRRMFLFSFLVVPFIGWIAVSAERRQIVSAAFGISILVVTVLLIITTTVFRSAREIRRLERERRSAEDQLRQAEKLAVTGRLAATLAHEVNNPLEAVTNILYLLDHDPGLASQSRQFLIMAQEELSRVSHITRQTLAFYREPVAPAVIQPAELVRQTVAVFEPKLLAKNLRISVFDFMQGEVTFFPGEFKQIVTNLLSNSMDASDYGGSISIRVRASRSWIGRGEQGFRVTVSDNGSGIEPEHRSQLFQPFFTTKGQKGTGLGLWVTQGLIQKHGGHLRMRTSTNTSHRGTTFSFFLPAKVQRARESQVTTAS